MGRTVFARASMRLIAIAGLCLAITASAQAMLQPGSEQPAVQTLQPLPTSFPEVNSPLALRLRGSGTLLPTSQTTNAVTESTIGMHNGRFWRQLEDTMGSPYLVGMLDGWFLSTTGTSGVQGNYLDIFSRGSGGSFTTNNLADMITSVYSEAENINLPIPWVAMGCLSVVRGETTRDLVFVALRKYLSMSLARPGDHTVPEIPVDVIKNAGRKPE